jgi:GDPmannose 4,6-dehydratase
MRVLVIGATGQDGSFLSEKYLSQGHEVLGISTHSESAESRGFEVINADLANRDECRSLLRFFLPDVIFHLATVHSASTSSQVTSVRTLERIYACNFVITQNILDWQRYNLECKSIIGLTSQMYSRQKSGLFIDESSMLDPRNFYAKTKAEAFLLLKSYRDKFGTQSSGAILFNHTSNRSRPEFLFPELVSKISRVLHGISSKIVVRDPNAELDICDAEEVCAGLFKMAELDFSTDFVFASGVGIQIRNLISNVMKKLSFLGDYSIERDLDDFSSSPSVIGNPAKAQRLLNWRAINSAEDILIKMLSQRNA